MPETGHDGEELSQALVVDGIGKTYGRRQVVKYVSLSVKPGEAVGLWGRTVPARPRPST